MRTARRQLALLAVVAAAAALPAGCGSSGSGSGGGTQDSAAARSLARRQAAVDREIARINARNPQLPDAESTVGNEPPATTSTAAKPKPKTPKAKKHTTTAKRPAGARPAELLSAADRAGFAQLASSLGGTSGIAVVPAGRGGSVQSAGSLTTGVAWSTMKTGIAAATFARGAPSASATALLRRAITASDNAAAEQLWSALGAPSAAGAAVAAQLQAAGDTQTQVQTQRVRSGFTAFGQTQWSLADQATFTAALPCSAQGRSVLGLMGQVISSQRWGLGSAGVPAKFKGGWGPGTSGGYLVRQMGILNIRGHQIAVTIATLPANGSFDGGTQNLTRIATWLAAHLNARAAPVTPSC